MIYVERDQTLKRPYEVYSTPKSNKCTQHCSFLKQNREAEKSNSLIRGQKSNNFDFRETK